MKKRKKKKERRKEGLDVVKRTKARRSRKRKMI